MTEILEAEEPGARLDRYVSEHCPDISRTRIQQLIRDGLIRVNEEKVRPACCLKVGDEIRLCIPEVKEPEIKAEEMDLDIIYEDADVILINKPKGMVVHPAAGHYTGTLVNGLLAHCRGSLSGINGELRPGIVHRIDRDTTGILVVCKNDRAHAALAEQFAVHSITRRYRAIVYGCMKTGEGIIDAPIGRHPTDRKKMAVNTRNGRTAVTHYRLLAPLRGFSYIECRLETGRTHQIRVHMASIGHPLLGDTVYGPAKCPIPGLAGQTLHAGVLGFIHPASGQYMEFTAPLPPYFKELLSRLEP